MGTTRILSWPEFQYLIVASSWCLGGGGTGRWKSSGILSFLYSLSGEKIGFWLFFLYHNAVNLLLHQEFNVGHINADSSFSLPPFLLSIHPLAILTGMFPIFKRFFFHSVFCEVLRKKFIVRPRLECYLERTA